MDKTRLQEIKITDLLLDPENPRLPKYVERDQDAMFEFLAKSSSIDELMSAISENDFFEAEPLIAIPTGEGGFFVVEGNRRLTALLLLSGKTYSGITNRIVGLQNSAKYRPEKVPVYICDQRSDVLHYLGNRHIAGVKAWGALAKARYLQQVFTATDDKDTFSERCKTVARVVGSRRDFISKTLRALRIFESAEENDYFGLRGVDESLVKFSIISTAVDYEGVGKFLFGEVEEDIDANGPLTPDTARTEEFFKWLFERRDDDTTLLGESRNLSKMSKVMANADGLSAIRTGASLDQAYLLTTGINDDFDLLCNQIQRYLREANAIASEVDTNEVREEITRSIFKQARSLSRLMEIE